MKTLRAQDRVIEAVKRVHMIGIGGAGMCPLAEILHSKGYAVSGSDNNESDPLQRIRALGIPVHMGHRAENLTDAQLVVYSAAIREDNPELVEARRRDIPTMERAQLLGALTRRFNQVVGVCGTHGKTTVTSLLTQIFYLADRDPTAVIGGRLPLLNANGRAGESEVFICEACEFVDTFLQLSPDTAVLLNIDNDHLDYFKTMDNLVRSFHAFLDMAETAVVNADDPLAMRAAEAIGGRVVTFGMAQGCDYRAARVEPGERGFAFDVLRGGQTLCRLQLSIPGRHNVYNALAAAAAADLAGIESSDIQKGVETFHGAGRRFEFLGDCAGVTLADDYAHHPTEIRATLQAAKALPYGRVVAIFQPFTFSRTALLKNDFIDALAGADVLILTPIMGSREHNTYDISSQDLADALPDARVAPSLDAAAELAAELARPGDLVLTMGGGDVYKAARRLRELLERK